MSKYSNHQNKLNSITLYLQKKFPDARFFSRHVGKFYSQRIFYRIKNIQSFYDLKQFVFSMKSQYLVSINKPGMSDQYVIFPIIINGKKVPVHIEIETKTGTGRLTADQIRWKSICKMMNVKFIESRDELVVEKEMNEYRRWLQS